VQWTDPFIIENKLNSANYVVQKGRGKAVVIHIDWLCKLPTEIHTDDTGHPASDSPATSPPAKRCKSDTAAAATSARRTDAQSVASRPVTPATDTDMASMEAANVTEPELNGPVTRAASTRGQKLTTRSPNRGLGFSTHIPSPRQSTDATIALPACRDDRPRPPLARRPTRVRRWPARYLQLVQAVLTNQACARSVTCRPGLSHAAAATCSVKSESVARARGDCYCCTGEDSCDSRSLRSGFDGADMPRSRILRRGATMPVWGRSQ